MAQAYGTDFAAVYAAGFGTFAIEFAERAYAAFGSRLAELGRTPQLLDLCCGGGHLSRWFLERGYAVTGLDLSAAMLEHARSTCADAVAEGRAAFVQADAADFTLDRRFDLILSSFDALNHLPDLDALASCFRQVAAVATDQAVFHFDLNTRLGLRRWDGTGVLESDDYLLIMRGRNEGDRAELRVTGFRPNGDGSYRRFDEPVYNTIFRLSDVLDALRAAGWSRCHVAAPDDLTRAVAEPESLDRAYIVARR